MLNIKKAKHAMKNYLILTAIAVSILALTAISFAVQNFSEKASAEPLSPEECNNYTAQKNSTETDLMVCYEAFGHAYNNELNFVNISNIISGECLAGGAATDSDKVKVLDTFDKNSAVDNTDVLLKQWNDYYDAIHECNVFLEKYDKRSDKTKPEDIPYIAEAYAIRGICYFDLVRLFENIPLVTTPNGYMSQQANVDDVYAQIAADLDYASDKGPEFTYDQDGNKKTNRATKWAARCMLSRVFLFYTNYYGKSTISNLPYPRQGQSIDVKKLDYYMGALVSSSLCQLNNDYYASFPGSSATYNRVVNEVIAPVEDLDALLGSYSKNENVFSINCNSETLSEPNRWVSKLGIYNAHQRVKGDGGGMLSVPSNIKSYLRDVLQMDFNDDVRGVSFVSYSHLDSEVKTDPATWDDSIQGWRDCTGLVVSKYSPLCYEGGVDANFDQPLVLVRYADVLMMAAEFKALTGEMDKAGAWLNQVLNRAHLVPSPMFDLESYKVNREIEFMFEGINYWDDLKWGKAAQKFEYLQNGYEVCNDGQWQFIKGYDVNNYKSKHFLPIPESVVVKYGYRQNAGW